jgi:hypothetical protein
MKKIYTYMSMLLTAILLLSLLSLIITERERYNIKNHTHTLELSSVLPFVFLAGM